MTASQANEPDGWGEFIQRPARYANAAHIRACFDNSIGEDLASKLGACARIEDRLSKLLVSRYGLLPQADSEGCGESDAPIALLPANKIPALARRAGAIWWAASFATAVRGSEVQALQKLLGEDLYRFALANRDMAGPARDLQRTENLEEAVAADGWSCFEAWRRGLPRAAAQRLLLKVPPGYDANCALEGVMIEKGPAIVRRAAEGAGKS